jgi:hypothetical protein
MGAIISGGVKRTYLRIICILVSYGHQITTYSESNTHLHLSDLCLNYPVCVLILCGCSNEIRTNVTTFTIVTNLLYLFYSCGMEVAVFFSDHFIGMPIWHFMLMIPAWILDGFTFSFVIFPFHYTKNTHNRLWKIYNFLRFFYFLVHCFNLTDIICFVPNNTNCWKSERTSEIQNVLFIWYTSAW